MKNLFGWDSGYVDRYSGMSDSGRFKKLTTKANVDMVLNNFSPFNKVKKQKHNTKTVISYSGTDIDKTVSPIVYNPGRKNSSQIIVNSGKMREHLDTFHEDDRDDEFIKMTKQAYVARAEHAAAKHRFVTSNHGAMMESISDGDLSQEAAKVSVDMGMQVSVAAQGVIQGVPMAYGSSQYDGEVMSLDLADALFTGKTAKTVWAQDMMDELLGMNKSRQDYNVWMDKYKGQLDNDWISGLLNESNVDIMSRTIPLQRHFSAIVEPKDTESSDACDVGHGKIDNDKKPEFVEEEKDADNEYSESNDTLEKDELSDSDQKNFFNKYSHEKDDETWAKRDAKMGTLAEALYESLAGKIGKVKSQNPAKRLNTRDLASGLSENIYVYKSPLGGKKLSLNLILDTSGSMSGHYIDDSVDVINCVNKLALRGVITGNLMLSCSGASSIMKLPINPVLLPQIAAHNGGEGFRHTFAIRWQELKEADYNVALTDGHLTDGHIDRKEMEKEGIFVTGLYSNPTLVDRKGDATKYTDRLTKWFSKSAIRSSAEELIYYMIDQAILNYDMNPRSAV